MACRSAAHLEVLGLAPGGDDARAEGYVLTALQPVARHQRGVPLHQLWTVALPEKQNNTDEKSQKQSEKTTSKSATSATALHLLYLGPDYFVKYLPNTKEVDTRQDWCAREAANK